MISKMMKKMRPFLVLAAGFGFLCNGIQAIGDSASATFSSVTTTATCNYSTKIEPTSEECAQQLEALQQFRAIISKTLSENQTWYQKMAHVCKSPWITVPTATIVAIAVVALLYILGYCLINPGIFKLREWFYKKVCFGFTKKVVKNCGKTNDKSYDYERTVSPKKGKFLIWNVTLMNYSQELEHLLSKDQKFKCDAALYLFNALFVFSDLFFNLPLLAIVCFLIPIVSCLFSWFGTHIGMQKFFAWLENKPKTSKFALDDLLKKVKEGALVVPAALQPLFDHLPENMTPQQSLAFFESVLNVCASQEDIARKGVVS